MHILPGGRPAQTQRVHVVDLVLIFGVILSSCELEINRNMDGAYRENVSHSKGLEPLKI